MPALPPVGAVLRCHWGFSLGSDLSTGFRLFIRYAGTAPTNAQCGTAATALFNAWSSHLSIHQVPSAILTSMTVTDLTTASSGFGEHLGSVPGTSTGTKLSANAAVVVNFGVNRRYRGGKPRVFLPMGRAEDLGSEQTWGASVVTAYQTDWNAFVANVLATPVGTASLTGLVSVSYYEGNTVVVDPVTGRAKNVSTPREGGPLVDTVVSQVVSPTVGSQRRRLYAR